jgi:hypothetical protein
VLRHDWNALRSGDRVLVHHSIDEELRLVTGVVTAVTADDGGNDITVRVLTPRGQQVVHPGRLSVHHDPIELDGHCWRCAALGPPTTAPPSKRRSA